MIIRPLSALCNEYSERSKFSKEKQEPIFLIQNGEAEMVLASVEPWEKREAELDTLFKLLQREQSRLVGAKTSTMSEMESLTEEILQGTK